MTKSKKTVVEDPKQAESRKKDHIELAFKSGLDRSEMDGRFYYEPMLSGHPDVDEQEGSFDFAGKKMSIPIWVSSMTGGTEMAAIINENLCRACAEFGMGFGLGSCRSLLEGNTKRLSDFDFREVIGPDAPFYANLGIAQLEETIGKGNFNQIEDLVGLLRADGLIIHVNPLQEALQPEGDNFKHSPLETIQALLSKTDLRLIVKEVGQGFGKDSMKALLQLPLQAIEFAAHGGTNFSKLELLRSDEYRKNTFAPLSRIGHTADEMVEMANTLKVELGNSCFTTEIIVSGGVKDYLDGYYYVKKSNFKTVYGQASGFLKYARGDYESLKKHVESQIEGYKLAESFLRIR